MPRVKHFRFEQRQIDVGWAFWRATFARETIAECSIQLGGFQRVAILKGPHPILSQTHSFTLTGASRPSLPRGEKQRRACCSTAVRMPVGAQLQRGANDVGAPARGHDLFARGDECWAHDRRVFAATATAVALLEIADERAILERKCKSWFKWQLERFGEILAEVVVDFGRVGALRRPP